MVLWATILFLQGAGFVGSMTGIPGVPENITVMFLNPTSVRVSWSTSQVEQIEKYDVTYKPTDASYRVVAVVAGNSEAVTLSGLQADTQYQLVVTAVRSGKKLRSRPIVFRTLEPPRTSPQQDASVTGSPLAPPPPPSAQQPPNYIQIRGVEVGIVVLVLIVWAGAIALFFNRWGKIRMLLPYQPDYKEQLKVPGTGACAAANATCPQHNTQHACSQHLHWSNHHVDSMDSGGGAGLGWPKTPRPRVNSAVDVAGFLSQEFLRRHGSTSKLCRKVRSADNLPLASGNRHHHHHHHHLHNNLNEGSEISQHNRHDEGNETERDTFLLASQEEGDKNVEDAESKRQSSLDSSTKDNVETSIIEHCYQQLPQQPQSSARDSPSLPAISTTPASLITRRVGGWRVGGSHEYVKCPVRQPASIDERMYRRSCEPDFGRMPHHQLSTTVNPGVQSIVTYHHHRTHHFESNERHSKSFDFAKRNIDSTSVDNTQHFGLPILSVSEPSPPDERERLDEYL
ncbi:uncharacterized protein [Venturia canescens]|uniref:uncharacterized protein isoform X2 n=1 Tax=Venturia canescens TaxID=32260 RepID=UPI001C9C8827|nr:uncharacterized protein LOC122408950 isoform X2 [Venturia canescens]